MKCVITIMLLFIAFLLGAQSMDTQRMKRDIEVGENILASLLQDSYKSSSEGAPVLIWSDRSNVEGSYLEGFGVLFTIASRNLLGAITLGDGQYSFQHNQAFSFTIPREDFRNRQWRSGIAYISDSVSVEKQFRSVVETFITDYAFLMRQLPANEKIMIRYGSKLDHSGTWAVTVGFAPKTVYSAAISKADLEAHQNGRLNREQLLARIVFSSQEEGAAKEDRDLALLTSIFARLYQNDLSSDEIFRLRGAPVYEKIEGLGAVIQLSVGSKYPTHTLFYDGMRIRGRVSDRVRIVVPERDKSEDKEEIVIESDEAPIEEDSDAIDEAYPEFLLELERNMVEYGSIVKDLKPDQALVFHIKFFACEACEVLPKRVEVTVPQSVLDAYRKGNLNLDKAVEQLKVSVEE